MVLARVIDHVLTRVQATRLYSRHSCTTHLTRIKTLSLFLITLKVIQSGLAFAAPPDRGLGVNLTSVHSEAPSLPFIDVFKQSRPWVAQRERSLARNAGAHLDLTEDGWIRLLSPGQRATKRIVGGGRYPAGRYLVSYDGRGDLSFRLDATIVGKRGKELVVEVGPKDGVVLEITHTDRLDPVRNIKMYLPGFDPAGRAPTFNPKYLDYLRGFQVIRYVGWSNANESDVVEWAARTRTQHESQYRKNGVALEYMIQFSGELNADPWFTVPARANDDYVRNMAALIKGQIGPERKFYLEYSNEVWNDAFPQHHHAVGEAVRLGLRDADDFYVRRSLQVFRIFEKVFGGTSRFVRILSGQAVNTGRTKSLLSYPNIGRHVDAFAIAPYFGYQDQLLGKGSDALDPEKTPMSVFMRRLEHAVAETREVIRANSVLASYAGLPLIAYEAGQHVTNPPGQDDFCAAINRDPRMADLYTKYIDIWNQESSGNLIMLAGDIFSYGRYGCWGLSEYLDQDLSTTPKLKAVRNYMRKAGRYP